MKLAHMEINMDTLEQKCSMERQDKEDLQKQ